MEKPVMLAELKAMANSVPDFSTYKPTSRPHLEWLGRTHALVAMWDGFEAISFRLAADSLAGSFFHDQSVSKILGILHRAIADLEIKVPELPAQAYGPGAVYDFLKNLRELLGSATAELFIVDPYLDDQVFDGYLSTVPNQLRVRLLVDLYASSVKAGLEKFVAQSKMNVEVRTSKGIHDRVVFVDGRSCWVLGQSIKDAAKSKPTYIAPIALDAMQLKLADYETIWAAAKII
jgi:hypothetical protein